MTLTISGKTSAGVTLVSADNPVTVTATGYAGTMTSTNPGLAGPSGTTWTITNYGGIASTDNAVSLAASGTLENVGPIDGQVLFGGTGTFTNFYAGFVDSNFENAVYLAGGGTVINNGILDAANVGSQNGVRIIGAGAVTNQGRGRILGLNGGVVVSGAAGSLNNASYVVGQTQYGVFFLSGGVVNNTADAAQILGGKDGMFIEGGQGTVNNAGTVQGTTSIGIVFMLGGTLTNQSTGTIFGKTDAFYATGGAATLTNLGSLTGTTNFGAYFKVGGTVLNLSDLASIYGKVDGVRVVGGSGAVTNAGRIASANTASGGAIGISLASGGSVTNQSGGSIYGGDYGIDIAGFGIVTNAGLISGRALNGIEMLSGGAVTNQNGGTIKSALENGVEATGGTNLINAGLITAASEGVIGFAGVTNQNGGTIRGSAPIVGNASMTVANAGLIVSPSEYAIQPFGGGAVTNLSGGTILGTGGIWLADAAAAVVNAGSVGGTTANGVVLDFAGSSVTNQSGGSISGAKSGVYASATVAGAATNLGSVSGATNGIYFKDGGTVANLADSASISGASTGVLVTGATGMITNAGKITSDSGSISTGISLASGGSIANQSGGSIYGHTFGIFLHSGTVTNAGVVSANDLFSIGIQASGAVTNQSGGTIENDQVYLGIYLQSSATETFVNAGLVTAFGGGVYLGSPGNATNQSGGTIVVGGNAIRLRQGTVINAGLVSSTDGTGVGGGTKSLVTNLSQGTIEAKYAGVALSTGDTLVNAGVVSGAKVAGVQMYGSATVTNQSGGTILGGISVYTGNGLLGMGPGFAATVDNAGLISAASTAVSLASGYANLVAMYPGATFLGTVNGGNTIGATSISTLYLMAGAVAGNAYGSIAGLGSQFVNFAQIEVQQFADWNLNGSNTLAAGTQLTIAYGARLNAGDGSFSDSGIVTINGSLILATEMATISAVTGPGDLTLEAATAKVGALAGSGTVTVDFDSALTLTGSVAATETFAFGGDDSNLTIAAGATVPFSGQIVLPAGASVVSQATTDTVSGSTTSPAIVTLDGTGAAWSSAGTLQVGGTAAGSFAVAGSAVATAATAVIAGATGGSGSDIAVTGAGSSLTVAGTLTVGGGGAGVLSVAEGGAVSAGSLDVAAATGGDGDVALSGAGSTLTAGGLTLGGQAAGELSILSGAQMTVTGGVVGSSKTAPGNLDVEGAGSKLTINGGTLTVGANGPAEFTLGIGATLSGEVSNGQFGVVSEYGTVDPATDPNDGTQNVGFGNSLIYDFYIANSGTIKITSGTATFYSPLVTDETNAADGSTSGLWVIGAHETLVMNTTSVDATQVFDFTSASAATLVIGQVPQASTTATDTFNGQTMPALTGSIAPGAANVLPGWDAPIENFQAGDLILLPGLAYGSATASGDVVTVWSQAGGLGSALGSLTFLTKSGAASPAQATLAATEITAMACFAAGTRIVTPDGWVKVENLRVGDRVRTAGGPIAPIVWVGRRAVPCARHPRPETVWPVRVARGAFGENRPCRDLYLSPDHAVFVNGVLVPVKLLINGTSIARMRRDRVTYYHIELPEHAVILAEGLPVESYLDTGDRANFDGGTTIRQFPDFAARLTADAASTWETRGAAPLVVAGKALAAARATVAAAAPPRGAVRRTVSGTT